MHIPINTIIFLAFIAVTILLQVYLSRRPGIWPGLALPILSFLFSLIYILSMAVPVEGHATATAGQAVLVALITNIPTAILLAIYFANQPQRQRNTPIDKMNIQDLD